jgi:putative ATP-dependent endonuclease of OLD family
LQAKGTVRLDRDARPLLLVEDPETRLHPIMLSVAWHLLNLLPLSALRPPIPVNIIADAG